jgi:Integrase core domain
MGHIGVKGLKDAAEGINFEDSTLNHPCVICAKANIKHSPFPQKASHRATRLLERIHCDICGPLPPSYGSYRYFILFICCYSRYISIYLMKSHDEAYMHFSTFRSLAENFCGQRISILRVDNAPELVRGKLEQYCTTSGITYEKTVPDTPNQNGVAERTNLTLASMARAMLLDAELSDWFWPFAVHAAVHIKNRVPHASLPPHKTPFELWHQHKPNLSHLRLFGSRCTSRILSSSLSKFEPRGEAALFLGYAQDAKGYILWVPGPSGRGGSVKIRRDVIFHGFPSISEHTDSSPLWDDVVLPDRRINPTSSYGSCTFIPFSPFT